MGRSADKKPFVFRGGQFCLNHVDLAGNSPNFAAHLIAD